MTLFGKRLIGLLFLLAAALLAAVVYFFRFAHRRTTLVPQALEREGAEWAEYERMIQDANIWLNEHPTEQISITSFDGLRLQGTYVPVPNARACVILFHGYRSWGMRDYAPLVPFYAGLGLSTVVVDQRACGASEGSYITFGIKERKDAQSWANYMDKRTEGKLPIVLEGISMGASTVMMAADLPLPKSVVGLIADCGFTSPLDIIAHCAKMWFHLPAFPMLYLLDLAARLWGGFGYRECSTLDTLNHSTLPIFFLHGGKDDFVPTYMTEQNYAAAAGWKDKIIISEAGHGLSYMLEMARCQQALASFIDHILGGIHHGE